MCLYVVPPIQNFAGFILELKIAGFAIFHTNQLATKANESDRATFKFKLTKP